MPKKTIKGKDLAAGFFSISEYDENESKTDLKTEKIVTSNTTKSEKNLGGRPPKEGLRNEQFTLTMNPELYEKMKIIANERTRGNFSALIDEAIKHYCAEQKIELSDIKVDKKILEKYEKKQNKKTGKIIV